MRTKLFLRTLALGGVAISLAAVGAIVYAADLDTEVVVNIAAQPLDSALLELSKQASFQLVLDSAVVASKGAAAVSGKMPIRKALERLLSHTDLDYRWTGERTVTIAPRAGPQPANHTTSALHGDPPLAQVNEKSSSNPSDNNPQTSKVAEKTAQAPFALEEIIVTGSRIPTAAGEQTLAVRSYTREDIDNSGQTSVGEFLNTLPDVSTFQTSFQLSGYGGMQAVQLHGLPVGTTLALLDGRRLQTNNLGFFDLSNIPLAAVERVEILPVGASAIYGADALGGAVNTILRKDFNGFEANASLEHASDVNNPSVNLAWGKSWERGSVSLIGSYRERGELLGIQREPTSSTSLPNLPAVTLSTLAQTSCAPGNVYSVDGSLLPGLSAPEAAIPAGITGKPTIAQFAATAGKQNLCNPLRYVDITPKSQREGALLSAHFEAAESMDLFTEILLSRAHLVNQSGPQLSVSQVFGGTVGAGNPYNPFGEAVNVSFAYPGAGTPEDESTSLIRPLMGVRGTFLADWHYEVTAYFSRDKFSVGQLFSDFQGTVDALASSNPATALNPFASGPPGTPQLLSSLLNPAVDSAGLLYDDRIVGGQGILRGPLLQLPTGALRAVIGGEYNQEKQDTILSGPLYTGIPSLFLRRNTYAIFGEARIPLLAWNEPSPAGERLALTLAARYDHSDDYGGKATWQSGLLWRVTEALSFRGGYGLSYQAPQLTEVSGPQFTQVGPLLTPDPFRGNQLITYPVTVVSGPNFNLKPETGDSFTLGLQYLSQALPGLQTSLTWYDLTIKNYIGAQSYQALLGYPNLFPGAVVRAPPSAQDQGQGFRGQITQLNQLFYNFGDIRVGGFDADISYAVDTRAGQFTPSLSVANIYKWQSAVLPGAPETNGVSAATALFSYLGGVGWSPRWKGTAALAWRQGPLSINLAGRYVGRYLDYQAFVPNTNELGKTWIFDFSARYELGQAFASNSPWLAHAYVSLGAVNLLNKTPPFSYTPYMYDLQEYDIRGRFLYLSLGLRF